MGILSQDEADQMIAIAKHFVDSTIMWPSHGKKGIFPIVSDDDQFHFLFDVHNIGKIELSALTLQQRYAKVTILARIDLGNKKHMNPDGTKVHGNHIHIYREGYNDSWAYDITQVPDKYAINGLFMNNGHMNIFDDFCQICHIQTPQLSFGVDYFQHQ